MYVVVQQWNGYIKLFDKRQYEVNEQVSNIYNQHFTTHTQTALLSKRNINLLY